jgi:hypothetical protein
MWFYSVIYKIVRFFVKFSKSIIALGKYKEIHREKFIEINEIKDWSKGENFFGNGRLF